MRSAFPKICILLITSFFSNVMLSQHSSCPKVLDESIQLYLPAHESIACEYGSFGKCNKSFPKIPLLSEQLYFFDTRFRANGVELIWQSKMTFTNEIFKVLRSRDGEQFQEIAEVSTEDFPDGQIVFLDNLPLLGNNHYILLKKDQETSKISNTRSVYVSRGMCHLETRDINNNQDEINMKYYVDNSGEFQLLVTDTEGHEKERKTISMLLGNNDVQFSLPTNGIYFVTLTNGYSSVTDLVIQSNGSTSAISNVAKTENENNSNK